MGRAVTIAEAWDILDAADAIGRAHGYECYPVIRRGALEVGFFRAGRAVAVVLLLADLDACATTAARRELVERRVAEAFASRSAALGMA